MRSHPGFSHRSAYCRRPPGAQVVTTSPAIITADTKNIVITFHADWGNRGMAGLPASTADTPTPVSSHRNRLHPTTGLSHQPGPTTPRNTNSRRKAPAHGPSTYQISGNTTGVPAGVEIKNMVFVFRDAAGSDSPGKDNQRWRHITDGIPVRISGTRHATVSPTATRNRGATPRPTALLQYSASRHPKKTWCGSLAPGMISPSYPTSRCTIPTSTAFDTSGYYCPLNFFERLKIRADSC